MSFCLLFENFLSVYNVFFIYPPTPFSSRQISKESINIHEQTHTWTRTCMCKLKTNFLGFFFLVFQVLYVESMSVECSNKNSYIFKASVAGHGLPYQEN